MKKKWVKKLGVDIAGPDTTDAFCWEIGNGQRCGKPTAVRVRYQTEHGLAIRPMCSDCHRALEAPPKRTPPEIEEEPT